MEPTKQCPMCAETIPADATVCPLCGTRLVSETPAPPAPAAARTPVPPRPDPAPAAPVPPRKHTWIWWLVGGIVGLCLCAALAVGGILLYQSGLLSFPPSTSPTGEIPAPAEPTARPQNTAVTLTIWHPFSSGSTDETILLAVIENAEAQNPGLNVIATNEFTSGDNLDLYMAAAAAGDGPDILLSNSSNLWSLVENGAVLGLDDYFSNDGDFRDYALQALTMDGTLYGLPISVQAVALYYNRSLVSDAPTSTDALLDLVKQGQGLDIPDSPAYFAYGFWDAFGGQLMDENGLCTADQGGFAPAVQYLLDLQDAGANVHAEYGEASDRFRNGETAMTINGPWALPDYESALGENLGVTLLPSGPAGPAHPLAGVSAFFVNAHSDNTENAIELALYLTSQDSAQIFTDQANYVPVRNDVSISDPKIVTFSLAGTLGTPFPPSQWMGGYWNAFSNLFYDVLDNGVSPDDAVQRACEAMNQTNGMP